MKPTTLADRLQLLRDRFHLLVGPLSLLFALGVAAAPPLAWTAGPVLLGLIGLKLSGRRRDA